MPRGAHLDAVDEAERFDALLDVLDELRDANDATPIVVEGQRDVASLRLLGMAGDLITLHTGEPLFQVAEAIAVESNYVILLTDWDRKGEILFEQLSAALAANAVRVDGKFRDDIKHCLRPTLNDIESLASYVGRNLARFHQRDLADLGDAPSSTEG